MKYINKNDSARGAAYTITNDASVNFMVADGDTPAPLAVKTWGTLIRQFGRHPEVKYCGVDERTCGFDTRGILYRHRLRIGWIDYIGKESPRLTSAEKQLPDPTTDVIAFATTEDRFREVAVPVLKAAGFQSRKSNIGVGLSVRALADALHKMGHPRASKSQVNEYLSSENLTQVTPTLRDNIRNPLIRLAVCEAVRLMGQEIPDRRWLTAGNWDRDCWDILVSCCRWLDSDQVDT